MDQVLTQVESSEDISVLHLRSACKTFCAGADLAVMQGLVATPEGCDAMVDLIRELQRVLDRLEHIGVVTIAEIGGAAVGGGFELALACDLRVCSESAKLGLPEASLGLIPGAGGTQRLPRICGEAVARRIVLGAEVVDGTEAARIGLVHWAEPPDQLELRSKTLAERLGALPRQSMTAGKRCIASSFDGSTDGFELELEETRKLYGHDDTRQRLRSFLQKTVRAD
jgi:enoyl-CoA hydratase/carnithine racemase